MKEQAARYNWPQLKADLKIGSKLHKDIVGYFQVLDKDRKICQEHPLTLTQNGSDNIYIEPTTEDIDPSITGGQGRAAKALPTCIKLGNKVYYAFWREHNNKPALALRSELEGEKWISTPPLAFWTEEARQEESARIATMITEKGVGSVSPEKLQFLIRCQECNS